MENRDFFIIPFMIDTTIAMGFIVLNLFAQDLGATPFQLGLMGFTSGVFYSIASVISGRLADNVPRRLLLTFGLLLYGSVMMSYAWCSTPKQIILLGFLNGLGNAFFWPVFETFLHEEGDSKGTNRRVGLFNIGWTLGFIFGSFAGGYTMKLGAPLVFRILAFTVLLNLIYLLTKEMGKIHKMKDVEPMEQPSTINPYLARYLHIAWIALFVVYFAGGATMSIFPKIARTESIPDGQIGMILALISIGQGITFFLLSKTSRWHYKFAPLLIFQGISAAGLFMLAGFSSRLGYVFGMVFQGIGRGMAYTSSLYYGLSVSGAKGANTGTHEMLIGFAFTFGPLFGGFVAQNVSLKSTFYLCAVVLAIGSSIQIWMRGKLRAFESV